MFIPAATDRYYSRDEVLAFPDDGNRYELVYGELLVTPAAKYSHQKLVIAVASELRRFLRTHPAGVVMISPADISFGRPDDVIVQPDVFVIAPEDAGIREWHEFTLFSLFVEVLSPTSARQDRFTKRRLYQEMGVPLYWVIDASNRRAEIWTPATTAPVYETERLVWQPEGVSEPWTMRLDELFAEGMER
jgi:Uma2 family endonuclease